MEQKLLKKLYEICEEIQESVLEDYDTRKILDYCDYIQREIRRLPEKKRGFKL